MKHLAPSRALRLAALVLVGASCVRSGHDHVPVFAEAESNDFAFEANHFGVLQPGDRLFVDGHITSSGFDPFDGFAFTAGQPIAVDFRLFADHPAADLDVCVYDPQLGFDVACFQSTGDPEVGSVEVFAGGLDFHLVVDAFAGASTYSLEVEVFALHLATAQGDDDAAAAPGPGVTAAGAAAEGLDKGERLDAYFRGAAAAGEPRVLETRTVRETDPVTGESTETSTILLETGPRMGIR